MGLYERKNAPLNHEEKVYIFHELEKYYCVKTINFFRKHNDKEINHQLRNMAFITLQKWGHYVKLRKKNSIRISAKNKKRKEYLKNIYSNLTYDIKKIPQELEYRIENNKDQKIKSYDYFISHSSLDYNEVQELIDNLNRQNKNIYCDWISDTNFLKRKLVGDATKKVIEKRMEQSKMMILLKSNNSIISNWVKYELNYFRELKKPIFQIDLIDKNNNLVEISDFSNQWFYDEEYKNINLY
ncbi:toll/interleukin-1 receptor domain-containing protein (plasmid) [Cetobacterium somerae]